jgi:hypothetical protein
MQRACHGLTLGQFAACLMRVDDASVCAGPRDGGMPLAADAVESNGNRSGGSRSRNTRLNGP